MNTPPPDREALERDGVLVVRRVISPEAAAVLAESLPDSPRGGLRNITARSDAAAEIVRSEPVRRVVESLLGPGAFLTRAILFDKRPDANWAVGAHRDETIAVRERVETAGFGPWSVKDGVPHVRPPREVLDSMLTIRLHLDAADEANGALLVWPGSHLETRPNSDASPVLCSVEPGDAVLMRPSLLHASNKATSPTRRRVLHLEFAADRLPGGLEWGEA